MNSAKMNLKSKKNMKKTSHLDALVSRLAGAKERKRVAVVCPNDASTQSAVFDALDAGFIEAIFVGAKPELKQHERLQKHLGHCAFEEAETPDESARLAVRLVRENRADVLMKGLVSTDVLLHAVLNKETGILPRGRVLTHIAAAELPTYDKLLFFTDAAVIPYPTQEQREAQVAYVAALCRAFGVDEPRISLVHCSEHVNEKYFPFTVGYADIKRAAAEGKYGKCIVDGPLDVKTSLHEESLRTKGIDSPLEGRADALIFPDIEAGNAFYKTLSLFCGAELACTLQGPDAPVVLPSRADHAGTKYYSLALACLAAESAK